MAKIINIYTDGACSGNQNDNNIGGWGCVLEYGQHTKENHGGEINTTNNRMELIALIEALSMLKEEGLHINVFSDSSYLVNCFKNKWYVSWKKNGWKNAAKKPVENQALWQKLLELLRKHRSFNFYLVKGHLNPEKEDSTLKKHFESFINHNGAIDFELFKHIAKMNVRCDELANVFISETKNS